MIQPNTARIAAYITFVSLFFAAFFTARQQLSADLAFVSSVAIIGFALPSYVAVVKLCGLNRGLIALLIFGIYALAVETSALKTGFPYGSFVYRDLLGAKLFGITPWTVAFAYPPILLFAYWLARRILTTQKIVVIAITTGLFAMSCDLVLDPAATSLGFWYWPGGGFFYDVPLVNFIGWIGSSTLGALIVHGFLRYHKLSPLLPLSGLLILFFFSGFGWPNIF